MLSHLCICFNTQSTHNQHIALILKIPTISYNKSTQNISAIYSFPKSSRTFQYSLKYTLSHIIFMYISHFNLSNIYKRHYCTILCLVSILFCLAFIYFPPFVAVFSSDYIIGDFIMLYPVISCFHAILNLYKFRAPCNILSVTILFWWYIMGGGNLQKTCEICQKTIRGDHLKRHMKHHEKKTLFNRWSS